MIGLLVGVAVVSVVLVVLLALAGAEEKLLSVGLH